MKHTYEKIDPNLKQHRQQQIANDFAQMMSEKGYTTEDISCGDFLKMIKSSIALNIPQSQSKYYYVLDNFCNKVQITGQIFSLENTNLLGLSQGVDIKNQICFHLHHIPTGGLVAAFYQEDIAVMCAQDLLKNSSNLVFSKVISDIVLAMKPFKTWLFAHKYAYAFTPFYQFNKAQSN